MLDPNSASLDRNLDLGNISQEPLEVSPLIAEKRSQPCHRALFSLGEADFVLYQVIDYIVENQNDNIMRQLRAEKGISGNGIKITFMTHENCEGSLYISSESETVRFRWLGTHDHRHIYLKDSSNSEAYEQAFMTTGKTTPGKSTEVGLERLNGDDVKEITSEGVMVSTIQMERDYNQKYSDYMDQARKGNSRWERVKDLTHRLTSGKFGEKIIQPTEPKMESIVKDPDFQQAIQVLNKTTEMLEKAAEVLGYAVLLERRLRLSGASLSGEKSQTLESARVWDKIEVSENLTVTFKDTKLSVQKVIDELAKEGVKFYLTGSFAEPDFLDRELAPQFRVVDTRYDQEGSKEVLKEAGLSAAPDNKLENLAVMLILYLKDKSGEELSVNEKRLLNCYDNRNRPDGEDYRWVSCGVSSFGVLIDEVGAVNASNFYVSGRSRFPSALLSSRN